MTDLLITVLLVGFAVYFCIEIVDEIGFFFRRSLNRALPIPLSTLGFFLLNQLTIKAAVGIPAACFVALTIGAIMDRPVAVNRPRVPRL
mgnify:CR=1 FL=1